MTEWSISCIKCVQKHKTVYYSNRFLPGRHVENGPGEDGDGITRGIVRPWLSQTPRQKTENIRIHLRCLYIGNSCLLLYITQYFTLNRQGGERHLGSSESELVYFHFCQSMAVSEITPSNTSQRLFTITHSLAYIRMSSSYVCIHLIHLTCTFDALICHWQQRLSLHQTSSWPEMSL